MKAIALRLDEPLHQQLSVVAQLQGVSLTEFIRTAIEAHLEAARQTPELAAKAQGVLDEIEQEAANRRDAIATLFAAPEPEAAPKSAPKPAATKPSARSRKASGS